MLSPRETQWIVVVGMGTMGHIRPCTTNQRRVGIVTSSYFGRIGSGSDGLSLSYRISVP